MGSKKRSAQRRRIAQFKAELGGMDDVYGRERESLDDLYERRDEARRDRACASKNRYASRAEAEEVIAWCAEHGRRGLSCYRCTYCHGWHLTSHPQKHEGK